MTAKWAWWRFKSPVSRLFTQPFIEAKIKENIKALRHWPLWGEFTGDQWIPRTKRQLCGKCFHLMTSSWDEMFIIHLALSIFHDDVSLMISHFSTLWLTIFQNECNNGINEVKAQLDRCIIIRIEGLTLSQAVVPFSHWKTPMHRERHGCLWHRVNPSESMQAWY